MSIFISYRRADSKYVVDRIRERLVAAFGPEAVFRDIESIPLGTDFRSVLNKETTGCSIMLVVIGPQWAGITDSQGNKRLLNPNDFTRIEVETGLQGKDILVIPVLVMNAVMPAAQDLPESLCELLYRNAISVRNDPDFDNDMQRLILGISRSQEGAAIQIPLEHFEPETIHIPQGAFWMGSDAGEGIPRYETPLHQITLASYRIGKYPVTNKQYEEFIRQKGKLVSSGMGWNGQRVPDGNENYPVAGVTFYEALAYCQWLKEVTGRNYFLPTEAQWEKACRADSKNVYPWGNEFSADRCNAGRGQLAPVDAFPAQSEYGCFDLVGNVRQWTCSLWGEKRLNPDLKYVYPWKEDGRNDLNAGRQIRRVIRGSSASDDPKLLRCSVRRGHAPDDEGLPGTRHGFRVALTV